MYPALLLIHSLFRWLVVGSLVYCIYRAYLGYSNHKIFGQKDDALRHWTATAAHLQLVIGILLYLKSPIIRYFWANF